MDVFYDELCDEFVEPTHEEFMRLYGPGLPHSYFERTLECIERDVLDAPKHPESRQSVRDRQGSRFMAAWFLAVVGRLGGPDSQLGRNRDEAVRRLRSLLLEDDYVQIRWVVEGYERSEPHPWVELPAGTE